VPRQTVAFDEYEQGFTDRIGPEVDLMPKGLPLHKICGESAVSRGESGSLTEVLTPAKQVTGRTEQRETMEFAQLV